MTPTPVPNLGGVAAIAAGGQHTCALRSDGSVACWGSNIAGDLGDGTTPSTLIPSTPAPPTTVVGLSGATAIAAGFEHTCAILADGTVTCWGNNGFGQLGNGTTIDSPLPAPVPGLRGAIAIAAGAYHTCVLLAGGGVSCWGDDSAGELGDAAMDPSTCSGPGADNAPCSTSPSPVVNVAGATAIAAGYMYSCALLPSGRVVCWGALTGSSTPTAVTW